MLLKIEDLREGDEFIVTSNGSFRYWKALENPRLLPAKPNRNARFGGLLCSTRMIATQRTHQGWGGRPPVLYTTKEYEYTPFEHNHKERINLNWKSVWLVRRDEI